ncbi:hypothetical protein LJ707_12150 [Mucilaginibacter sp. UR6-1]|uniref:hypothetical protein n=1 Tax=Mucilaginibacter sp. UR6-1 TaxID=1435643 RepID=UPI001E569912|nr:hypothetical protein [Mucilaginibacter sp. UR6-1]MCC8409683.1 hypothetical protein [Mucilaginibacter sp. UR6-1]
MKKLIITTAILLSFLTIQKASAQLSVNINIGSQPAWGPTGYDYVNYYYLPDIDTYYDVPARRYVYLDNNVWVHRTYLPTRYRNYNLYKGYKVVLNDRDPWRNHTVIHNRYITYKGRPSTTVIRDSRDVKYTKYRGHHAKVTHVKYKSYGKKTPLLKRGGNKHQTPLLKREGHQHQTPLLKRGGHDKKTPLLKRG